MSTMHLWQEDPDLQGEMVTVRVTLETILRGRGNTNRQPRQHLWYRVAEKHQHLLTSSSDPFVVAVLLMAMHQGTDLVVHGAVSPSLLINLEEFQTAWVTWAPRLYKPITIQADAVWTTSSPSTASPPSTAQHAISTFSGGVDSCFTAFRYRITPVEQLRYQLTTGLIVHGFDIPLQDKQMFQRAALRSQRMLASLGLDLIEMATNFREVIGFPWDVGFITAIASSLLLFQEGFAAGIIPSSVSYASVLEPMYASNPISDRLLSNHRFELVHDRLASRVEKLAVLAGWSEALQDLRVCWQGTQKDRNCGQCEKCIRTILSCRVAGIGLPPCFEQDISDLQVLALRIPWMDQVIDMEEVLHAGRAAGIRDSWLTVLAICILLNRGLNVCGQGVSAIKVMLRSLVSTKPNH